MKTFLFLALFLSSLTFAVPIQDHVVDPIALFQLASALNIPQDADLIAETQKHWLRKSGQERWEQTELSSEQRELVLHWAHAQGLFSTWEPSCKTYDTALILG